MEPLGSIHSGLVGAEDYTSLWHCLLGGTTGARASLTLFTIFLDSSMGHD